MPRSVVSQIVATTLIFPGLPDAQGAVCLFFSSFRTHNRDLLVHWTGTGGMRQKQGN